MPCKIIVFLLLIGLVAVKTTNAQTNQDILGQLIAEVTNAQAQGNTGLVGQLIQLISAVLEAIATGIAPKDCNILVDGQVYYLQSVDGRFAVVDANKQLAFMQQMSNPGGSLSIGQTRACDENGCTDSTSIDKNGGASQFTAFKKSCNVYGLCVNGFCMSRCEGCPSDTNDYESARFHLNNSDQAISQWTLSSSVVGGPYNLKVDDPYGYLTYKKTPSGADQVTLSTTLTNESKFKFVNCGILKNGTAYYLQSTDGKYAVVDGNQIALMQQVPATKASKFIAMQKNCDVYGLCVDGLCMSRCLNCPSYTGDQETILVNLNKSDAPYSQWTLYSNTVGGPYYIKTDDPYGFLVSKQISDGNYYQLGLSTTLTEASKFNIISAK